MSDAIDRPTTIDGAQARLSELTASKDWAARLVAGDVATRTEFQNLSTLAAGLEKRPGAEELSAIATKQNDDRNAADFIRGVREQVDVRDEVLAQVIGGEKITKAEHDAAKAWQTRHFSDEGWTKRLLAGDADAKRELFLCSVILSSDIKEAS